MFRGSRSRLMHARAAPIANQSQLFRRSSPGSSSQPREFRFQVGVENHPNRPTNDRPQLAGRVQMAVVFVEASATAGLMRVTERMVTGEEAKVYCFGPACFAFCSPSWDINFFASKTSSFLSDWDLFCSTKLFRDSSACSPPILNIAAKNFGAFPSTARCRPFSNTWTAIPLSARYWQSSYSTTGTPSFCKANDATLRTGKSLLRQPLA